MNMSARVLETSYESEVVTAYEIFQHKIRNSIYAHIIYVANTTKVKAIMSTK